MKGKKVEMTRRDKWHWTLMILVPDFVTPKMFSEAVAEVRSKKNRRGSTGRGSRRSKGAPASRSFTLARMQPSPNQSR